jgi:hypothetical protein
LQNDQLLFNQNEGGEMKDKSKFKKVLAFLFLLIIILACRRNEQIAPAEPDAPTDPVAQTTAPDVFESSDGEDGMTFITDVSIPDGFVVDENETFIKTWRIQNSGTRDWYSYLIAFESGEPMGTMEQVIPDTPAGETLDISIEMTAPGGPGSYSGRWEVQSPEGVSLGGLTCVITVSSGGDSKEEDSGEPEGGGDISAPAAPTNFRSGIGDMETMTVPVNWDDNSDNEDGFKIMRIGVSWLKNPAGPNETSFTIHNKCGEVHQYYVVAFNAAGNSEPSNTILIESPQCD